MTPTTSQTDFPSQFEQLTKYPPLRWQVRLFRLFRDHSAQNLIPPVIDLPTGLGKTMVMAIWLIARAINKELPRRLIYVVDRRTVVDQATDLAISLMKNAPQVLPEMADLAVSTLRGQLADNRAWTRDPSRPAIIIGTVDMIGSRLLFSGYRSSYKQRPLDAGLLGQDSLLVLDEAHLSKPFEKLICAINRDGPFQKSQDGHAQGNPMRIIRMSATSGRSADSFTLQFDANGNLTGEDAEDSITTNRFNARKCLTVQTLGEKDDLNRALAKAAIKLANDGTLVGKRIVVFVRSPEDAKEIAKIIKEPSKSKSNPDPKGPYADSVELLTGTMRGLERDELVEKPVFKNRWLNGELDASDPVNQQPVFLVSTSAGEVGFDLNADHLVGDAAPLDSWIQRLGRVNRRGTGDATVILIRQEKAAKNDFDKACITTSKLFTDRLDLITDRMDVSPKALDALKKTLTPEQIKKASTPEPRMLELTDILLDAWSMTSITERMPGRPEVSPWLRGVEKEQAETSIAWRAELELFSEHPNPARALKAVFAKHRIRPHECLTIDSNSVIEFLKECVKPKGGRPHLLDTALGIRLPRGEVVIRTIRQLNDDPGILYAEPTLILPATFGGLDDAGMLSAQAIPGPNDPPSSLDVADNPGYEQRDDATPRLRLIIRTDEGHWVPESLRDGESISQRLILQESYSSSRLLFDDLRNARRIDGEQARLRIRLVQPVKFDDEGEAVKSLVILAPVMDKNKPEDQTLVDHVEAVVREAVGIADRLELKGTFRDALLFAAWWHDEGKKADIWQRYVYREESSPYKGKSSKTRDPKSLRGYRHEFGSLMRIHHPDCHATDCSLPTDAETRDLALHLIATHHGFGRPHFDNPTDRNFQTKLCNAIHAEAIRRFARLQRKYGWWHLAWLENLLRCADALASVDDVSEDDVGEGNQESGEDS